LQSIDRDGARVDWFHAEGATMNPVRKALWFIESHYASEITLDEIADVAGVTRFHLCRVFRLVTGHSPLEYVRERRLTDAARQLASGASNILEVALDACYASHEAFTRAFRDRFGCTPETLRAHGNLGELQLQEPLRMKTIESTQIEATRMQTSRPIRIAGLKEHYAADKSAAIPSQWQRFIPYIGHVPGQTGNETYGLMEFYENGEMDYTAGVEVGSASRISAPLALIDVPEQFYAVFTHRGHVSDIRLTCDAIWNDWFPRSGARPANGPQFEKYDSRFDPSTGHGEMEIWIPVQR
jgi:AraC family transcriptional regulator